MRIDKSCDFALWDGIIWLTGRPISFTASISYGHSEKPEDSLSSNYFCIIVLHDCVPKHASERSDSIYCVSSSRSEVQVIYVIYENYYIQWLLLYS